MKIIALTGTDASGKDTQTSLLAEHLRQEGKRVRTLSIWDSLQDFDGAADPIILQKVIKTFLVKFTGEARSLFLASCLKNAMARVSKDTDILLINGYFYKYWASEVSYGVNFELWSERLASLFPQPDLTIFIDTPVEKAIQRRDRWSEYESGGNLLKFQSECYANFKKILRQIKPHRIVNGDRLKTNVHLEIVDIVKAQL